MLRDATWHWRPDHPVGPASWMSCRSPSDRTPECTRCNRQHMKSLEASCLRTPTNSHVKFRDWRAQSKATNHCSLVGWGWGLLIGTPPSTYISLSPRWWRSSLTLSPSPFYLPSLNQIIIAKAVWTPGPSSPVSIQTQLLALRALRLDGNRAKRKRLRWKAANHCCHCFDRASYLSSGICAAVN